MAKNAITDYSSTAANNTDIGGVDAQGSAAASNIDDLIRELASHLADMNAGTSPLADTFCVADPADLTKKVRIDAGSVTAANTRVINMPDGDVTLVTGTLITTTSTSTLTNKTLTSPAIATADATGTWTTSTSWTLPAITAGGTISMADNILSRPKLIDYGETVNAIGGIGGGAQDIDITLGNVVTGTVDTAATTFTFSNPSGNGIGCSFTLILTNGGSQTVNWPASVQWAGGSAPTLTAAGVDILTFVTVNAGTTWYGFTGGLDFS